MQSMRSLHCQGKSEDNNDWQRKCESPACIRGPSSNSGVPPHPVRATGSAHLVTCPGSWHSYFPQEAAPASQRRPADTAWPRTQRAQWGRKEPGARKCGGARSRATSSKKHSSVLMTVNQEQGDDDGGVPLVAPAAAMNAIGAGNRGGTGLTKRAASSAALRIDGQPPAPPKTTKLALGSGARGSA